MSHVKLMSSILTEIKAAQTFKSTCSFTHLVTVSATSQPQLRFTSLPYFCPAKNLQHPYHPLFMTASHSQLLDVTSRLAAFSLLLLLSNDPAANAPRSWRNKNHPLTRSLTWIDNNNADREHLQLRHVRLTCLWKVSTWTHFATCRHWRQPTQHAAFLRRVVPHCATERVPRDSVTTTHTNSIVIDQVS